MTLAYDGTPGVTPDLTLTGGAQTFTIPLPVTLNGSGVLEIFAAGQVYTPDSCSDNSGVTGPWVLVGSSGALSLFRTTYSGNITSGKLATVHLPGANDNVGGASLATSGADLVSASGGTVSGTTSDLLFTASGQVSCVAFYETSSGSTGAGGPGGSGWGTITSRSGISPIVAGDPGITNSVIFGRVIECQIVTSPSSLDATLTSGTPTNGIGEMIKVAGAAPAATYGTLAMMGVG
jgi:hypothetical protein